MQQSSTYYLHCYNAGLQYYEVLEVWKKLAIGQTLELIPEPTNRRVMILLFKPFGVGDLIETQGYTGVVKEIQIFVTILLTPENKTVILPKGAVANGEITNYATEGTMRVDLTFGI